MSIPPAHALANLTPFSRHKQKNVDLTVPFRIAGLAGGAKLDLVVRSKSPAPVAVAVAIPPPDSQAFNNGRLGVTVPSSFTIWQVLRQIENLPDAINAKLNITARGVASMNNGQATGSGQLLYEAPVLNIMGRELGSFADYQRTLSQLGYNSGSVLIRLVYKTPGITFFEAQEQISQYFKEVEQDEAGKPTPSTGTPSQPTPSTQEEASSVSAEPSPTVQMQDAPAANDTPESAPLVATEPAGTEAAPQPIPPTSAESTSAGQPPAVPQDPLAPIGIFSAPSSSTPAAARAAISETDFTPSIAHAQLHQARLLEGSRNKRLLSDKQLAEQAAATEQRLSAVKSIEVKVRFPDNTSATWVITHDDTGAKLYKAVRSVMDDPSLPFHLVVPGTKNVIRDVDAADNRVIRAHKLTGRVLVNLVWDDGAPAAARGKAFLKSSASQAARDIEVPDVPVVEEKEEKRPEKQPQQKQESSSQGGIGEDAMKKKIGKFFKLPGKK